MDVNRYSRFLVDIYGYFKSLVNTIRYLILVKFSRIIRLVESGKFLKYRINISRNLRLINFSKFFKFWFRVKAVFYRAFLFATGGSK